MNGQFFRFFENICINCIIVGILKFCRWVIDSLVYLVLRFSNFFILVFSISVIWVMILVFLLVVVFFQFLNVLFVVVIVLLIFVLLLAAVLLIICFIMGLMRFKYWLEEGEINFLLMMWFWVGMFMQIFFWRLVCYLLCRLNLSWIYYLVLKINNLVKLLECVICYIFFCVELGFE